ncbi:MotA/TolQ/ExbB proton channel family protein [Thalassoglobus polymorphus]|uniref:Biopolymer transport protein ExbB n=1 Tax=Thalassoglobus polymorphus TaxID=2527994 RepID=A0A517QIZ2_9PLAN|nr:MotA/TolQ/ExbB proton channel family protein [Thalassoglobus polymorphus]QDT31619.1 Biopolymer transport protein ExbB [Thalassoglobus polymorphus]
MAKRFRFLMTTCMMLGFILVSRPVLAAEGAIFENGQVNPQALLQAGGAIGYVIIALSVAMVALVMEHLLSIRKGSLMPRGLAEQLHQMISAGQFQQADQLCRQRPTFLSYVVMSGLQESNFGYNAVEKSMEDACVEQAARLSRKIEYLSVIGSLAPMLGLMGTVWGMIQAFAEFTEKANPMPADFAPAISEALVTTLFGLCVAVPALAAYAWFRNRIDEYVAETTLMAEHLVSPLRRSLIEKRKTTKTITGTARS